MICKKNNPQLICMSKMFTIFAASYILNGVQTRLYATGFFYAWLQTIYGFVPPCVRIMQSLPFSRCRTTGQAKPFYICLKQTINVMSSTTEDCLTAKDSTCKQRRRTKRATSEEPQPVQVIHQIIIPETPVGLIGEKVVFTDKFLKDCPDAAQLALSRVNTPYFTIIGAWLEMRKNGVIVMVKVDISGFQWRSDGVTLSYFKKYEL